MSQATAAPAGALDMTQGTIVRPVLRYTLPLIIGNLFQLLYNLVDSLVVGNVEGAEALAAVGSANQPMQLVMAMFLGIGVGANILVSQYFGGKDFEAINRVVRTATSFLTVCAAPLTVLGILAAMPLLRVMRLPEELVPLTYRYLAIAYLGTLANLGYNLNAGILRGLGDSKSPLYFLVWACVANIGLDLLFVLVLGLGVVGVAVATVISQYLSWILSVRHIQKHYPAFGMKFFRLPCRDGGEKGLLGRILRIGVPLGLTNSINSMGHIFLRGAINIYGAGFIAGYVVSSKIDSIQFFILVSFGTAATAFTGQNFGARQYERMRQGLRKIMALSLVANILVCVPMLLFGKGFIRLFNRSPEVVEAGYNVFLWLLPFYWIYVIFYMLNQHMNGMGIVRVATLSNLFMFWGVRIPSIYLISHFLGKTYLFASFPLSWLLGLLATGGYYIWFAKNKWSAITG